MAEQGSSLGGEEGLLLKLLPALGCPDPFGYVSVILVSLCPFVKSPHRGNVGAYCKAAHPLCLEILFVLQQLGPGYLGEEVALFLDPVKILP